MVCFSAFRVQICCVSIATRARALTVAFRYGGGVEPECLHFLIERNPSFVLTWAPVFFGPSFLEVFAIIWKKCRAVICSWVTGIWLQVNSSNNTLASCKSLVSKPSVNQP